MNYPTELHRVKYFTSYQTTDSTSFSNYTEEGYPTVINSKDSFVFSTVQVTEEDIKAIKAKVKENNLCIISEVLEIIHSHFDLESNIKWWNLTRSESHRLSNLLKLNSPFPKLQNVSDICVIGFELADLILEEIENENS